MKTKKEIIEMLELYIANNVKAVDENYLSGIDDASEEIYKHIIEPILEKQSVLFLREKDGNDTYYHGAYLIPEQLTPQAADLTVSKIYDRITKTVEDWNYDDIHEQMRKQGFTQIDLRFWDE